MNIETNSITATLLAQGCTERQMVGIKTVLGSLEHETAALHMQIHALRSLAHTESPGSLARFADTVLYQSNAMLAGLREQGRSLDGLLGLKEPPEQ